MSQYRIIVIDDEILVRQGLSARLGVSNDLKVVGVCSTGPPVLDKLAAGAADAVVLDMEMPDALTLLKSIRDSFPDVQVVAIAPSDSAIRRTPAGLLTHGRSEAVVRPGQSTTAEAFLDELAIRVRKTLLELSRATDRAKWNPAAFEIARESKSAPAISVSNSGTTAFPVGPDARSGISRASGKSRESGWVDPSLAGVSETASTRINPVDQAPARSHKRVQILAIASSTGGPQALTELLAALPADFAVPIVIVQHMPAEFTKNLADRLDAACPLKIREAAEGDVLQPGVALIAPGDFHMELKKSPRHAIVTLHQGPMENSCRPAADVLFRSVADVFGPAAFGLVLTGMGKDGLAGTKAIVEAGGRVIAQDESSSVVWGMPGEIARAGLADAVLPLRELPSEIQRRVSVGRI